MARHYFKNSKPKEVDDILGFNIFKSCPPPLLVNPAPIVTISCT